MAQTDSGFGWLGWLSVFGFLLLGLLALLDATATVSWPLSTELTAGVAIVAGVGAALLWFGDDPTADASGPDS